MQLTERRKCAEPRCERLFIPKSSRHRYCLEHRRTKPRDPMHDIRYGAAHRRLRAQVASRVRAGLAVCARCGEPIHPNEPWDSVTLTTPALAPTQARSTLDAIARRTVGDRSRGSGEGRLRDPSLHQPDGPMNVGACEWQAPTSGSGASSAWLNTRRASAVAGCSGGCTAIGSTALRGVGVRGLPSGVSWRPNPAGASSAARGTCRRSGTSGFAVRGAGCGFAMPSTGSNIGASSSGVGCGGRGL